MNQDQFSYPILTRNTVDTVLHVKEQKDSVFIAKDTLTVLKQDTVVKPIVDSLFTVPVTSTTQVVVNPVVPITSVDTNYQKTAWFIAVLMVILILISKIKMTFPRLTPSVLQSYLRSSEANKLLKSRNTRNTVCYAYMNLLSIITSSVFVFELGVHYNFFDKASPIFLLYITVGIIIFILFKIILAKILGFIFRSYEGAAEYSFNLLLIWKTVGIVLIPFVLCIPFIKFSAIPYFLIMGLSVVGFSYILVILRGIKILFTKHVSFLYMILYLCALEMVPLVIAYKYIMSI